MEENNRNIMANLVRVGIVTDLNMDKLMCRVKYPDTGITSGWLYVLQHIDGNVAVKPDNDHNHVIHDTYSGGGSSEKIPKHHHPGTLTKEWMPYINDGVLVLYVPTENGDGFVLGGIF